MLTMRSKMLSLSALLSLCLLVHAENATHPKSLCGTCECLGNNPFMIDCDNMDLKEIPEVKKDMKTPWQFQLKGNAITTVTSFPFLENLTCLSLQYNKISKIEDNAFMNLTNLEILELSHNLLTADSLTLNSFMGPYSDTQPNPMALKSLDLSYNQINRFPKGFFIHLRNLTSLHIGHNPFVDFSIKTAQAISELHNLKELDLSYTSLQRLPDHFFAELTSLTRLDLSGNNFVTVPDEVNFAVSLRSLSINDNTFGILYGHSFWDSLKNLETLRMSRSKTLFRIEDGAFGNLTSLQTLYLNDNPQLSILMVKAFTNKFNQTPHLQELHLDNNRFESVPKNALPWSDIPLLNLQGNPWNCDCGLEWLVKGVMMSMTNTSNYLLTMDATCASPKELMGLKLTDSRVQTTKLLCKTPPSQFGSYGFLVIATIVVGTLLLVTGTILFSYMLFRRTEVQDWLGNNVKYRRTQNDDEEIVTSTNQY